MMRMGFMRRPLAVNFAGHIGLPRPGPHDPCRIQRAR
jgi:hypothetical protein